MNASFEPVIIEQLIEILKEFKDIFCLDIQGPEGYTPKDFLTQDWTWYYSTTYSSNELLVES